MKKNMPVASLDRILEATGGISRFRQFVLDAATSGRLAVPSDGEVSSLNQLSGLTSSIGKLAQRNSLRKLDIHYPGELPDGWRQVQLTDLGRIFGGNSVSDSERETLARVKEGYPFIATKDVGRGDTPLNYENGLKVPFDNTSYKVAAAGAVFICAEGGSAGKKCGITDRSVCFGNKLYAIEVTDDINPQYLLLVYQSSTFYESFLNEMTGMIGGVSLRKFLQLPILVPSKSVQDSIVHLVKHLMQLIDDFERAKLDREKARDELISASLGRLLTDSSSYTGKSNPENAEVMRSHILNITGRLSTETHIGHVRQLISSLAIRGQLTSQNTEDESISSLVDSLQTERDQLLEHGTLKRGRALPPVALDEVFQIPPSWRWVRLQDLLIFGPQNGLSPQQTTRVDAPRAVTLTATTSGSFDARHFKKVDADIPDDSELWLRFGDLLFQRGNSREHVGISAVYKEGPNEFIYPDLMIKVRVSDQINVDYIHLFANSPFGREYFTSRATGAQTTMPKINQVTLLSFPIALPPKAEQSRIVSTATSLNAICDKLETEFKSRELETEMYLSAVFGVSVGKREGKTQPAIPPAPRDVMASKMKNKDPNEIPSLPDHRVSKVSSIGTVDALVECLRTFGPSASPRDLHGASGLGTSNDDIEVFLISFARRNHPIACLYPLEMA